MAEEKTARNKNSFSADWLLRGVLAKVGDVFDRFTGRDWKPSSSLATSELSERLKRLVDAEARESDDGRRFVPHNIKLKMQWDKFSIDSEDALRKLEVELLTALVDHINDRRYYTYSPISLEVKADYFTTGVKLHASFDNVDEEREVSIDVGPSAPNSSVQADPEGPVSVPGISMTVRYEIAGNFSERVFQLSAGDRLTVGRTKESDIALDDPSVSKMHASLSLKQNGELVVADIGSTNGTFVNGERIAYGKAQTVAAGNELTFGTVRLTVLRMELQPDEQEPLPDAKTMNTDERIRVGDFEFTTRHGEETSNLQPVPPGSGESEKSHIGPGPTISRILTPLTNDSLRVNENGGESRPIKGDEKK